MARRIWRIYVMQADVFQLYCFRLFFIPCCMKSKTNISINNIFWCTILVLEMLHSKRGRLRNLKYLICYSAHASWYLISCIRERMRASPCSAQNRQYSRRKNLGSSNVLKSDKRGEFALYCAGQPALEKTSL